MIAGLTTSPAKATVPAPPDGLYSCSTGTTVGPAPKFTIEREGTVTRGYSCTGIVDIPEGVVAIGAYAFEESELDGIRLPSTLTSIEAGAFTYANSLTSINIPSGVTSIGNNAFGAADSLSSITVESGSEHYQAINGVLFNKNVTEIIQYPLGIPRATSGPSYVIPSTVTRVGNGAFEGVTALTSINIPLGVTSIGMNAFRSANAVTSINIPLGVTSIGKYAFEGASSLTAIDIPAGVTSIEEGTFGYLSSVTTITIPQGVISIGDSAFAGATSLQTINIPSSVTSIGQQAFANCSQLASVELQSGITSISDGAFGSGNLTSITIPASVTFIGQMAFDRNPNLHSIFFLGDEPVTGRFGDVPLTPFDPFGLIPRDVKVYVTSGTNGFATETNPRRFWYVPVEVGVPTAAYNSTGGTSVASRGFMPGGSIDDAPTPPTRAGYAFGGWSATDGGSTITFPYTPGVTNDITLYAKWTFNPVVDNSTPVTNTPAPSVDSAALAAAADLAARTIYSKKKYSSKTLAQQTGVAIVSSKATVTISVAKSSKKICTKSGSKLKTLKTGTCVATFTVQEPKPKGGKKPKAKKTVKTLVVK
jgi:uncharacterized repeat protein (TIGR02543 family)